MQKKILIIGIIMVLLLNVILIGFVNATGEITQVYTEGRYTTYLTYNGVTVGCIGVSYNDGNMKYPAYCLDRDLPGIGESDFYDVEKQDTLTNNLVWRVVSNSYPYVSLAELGVNTVPEAFVATKQAVYCILYGNDADNFARYSATDECGERVFALMKRLVNNARNSNTVRPSRMMQILETNYKWEVDNLDKKYISKTFNVSAEAPFSTYEVHINLDTLPEDTRITDIQNMDKTTFSNTEKFKVLIPINHAKEEGNFNINVSADLRTCPVYYGKAPAGKQSYALAAYAYEQGSASLNQTFIKNKSKITIIKKDSEDSKPLANTEFNILDEDKNVQYSNLITNEKGEVTITGVEPGKYYLQETKAISGYQKVDKLVEFNMELNKEISIFVNNSKIQKSNLEVNTEKINISSESAESNVSIKEQIENLDKVSIKNVSNEISYIINKVLPKTGY